jgi:pimeloyl-ACP methyl ester carboxylesterase
VLYLHGGPGGRAVPDLANYDGVFARFREDRDVVLFDQRASGISDATVTCFNTLGDHVFALAARRSSAGIR